MTGSSCSMEGCVLWADHAGSHTSKPYWPSGLRETLRRGAPIESPTPPSMTPEYPKEASGMSLKTTDEAQRFARRYRSALLAIHGRSEGCERLVWPSECRGRTGYPPAEWCVGCIAGDALGFAVARPVEHGGER